ncbi:MAG: MBL fold metallo-hydrolase [Christiangramia sp.]|nr:MBL fold metallo-hydrolase [Christiangramia sp.]
MGLKQDFFYLPEDDEIEITLIGTGGGYGEAVVIKFNINEWAIIDSCVNPSTKEPLTTEYLSRLGVDLSQVKFVLCTHWHDDHIRGLSKVLEKCTSAQFCMPHVNDRQKFLEYVNLDCAKIKKGSIASFQEFKKCLEVVRGREKQLKRLKADLVICQRELELNCGSKFPIELYSLSPSESVIEHFDKELSQLFAAYKLNQKSIPERSANNKSAVIYFKYGTFTAVLGADLEVSPNSNEGWLDIKNNSEVRNGKSVIYKIPHHGSSNGYDEEIYTDMFEYNAILKLSPWNRHTKLPQTEMLQKYKEHSDKLYITSSLAISSKPKTRDKNTNKLVKLFSRKLSEIKFDEGIVRTRHSLKKPENIKTETFGSAFRV